MSVHRDSWDEDDSIRTTNDDAQASKASCVQLGYFEDRFIQHFVKKKVRKPPLINRGYYTRHRCVSGLIHRFRKLCQERGCGCQVLNLGAGFDTTFWQLKDQGVVFDKFVEVDHDEVILRKAHAITTKSGLQETLEKDNSAQYDTVRGSVMSQQYCALSADLRDLQQVKAALDKAQLDPSLPTLILSECVLVYMKAAESKALIELLVQTFSTCAIAIYEPMNPESKFGQQMVKNLEARGSPLHGIYSTPTVEAHKERLAACGYERSFAADLNEVYRQHLDPQDRKRIEGLEIFDEFEEWHLIMAHYIVAVGVHDSKDVLEGLDFETYEDAAAVAIAPHGGSPHRVPLPTAGPLGRASNPRAGLPNAD